MAKTWTEYIPQNTGFTTTSWFPTPPGYAPTYEDAVKANNRSQRNNAVKGCQYRVVKRTVTEEVVTE